MAQVGSAQVVKRGVAYELYAVVERIYQCDRVHARGQPRDGKECAREQKHGREHRAGDVVEVVDRLRHRRDQHSEGREAEAGEHADQRHKQHPPHRVKTERDSHQQRCHAVHARAQRDPQHLTGDQLLRVHRRGQHRVIGALELPAHKRVEHARERGGEQDRGGHHAGGHVLHVGQVTNVRHQRTEPEPEREQVDDRLHHRGEGGRLPVAAEHHHVTAHHACQRGGLEAVNAAHRGAHGRRAGRRRLHAHSISSPVSATNASSRFAGRRTPSGAWPSRHSARRIASAGPLRRLDHPLRSASSPTSTRRSGRP